HIINGHQSSYPIIIQLIPKTKTPRLSPTTFYDSFILHIILHELLLLLPPSLLMHQSFHLLYVFLAHSPDSPSIVLVKLFVMRDRYFVLLHHLLEFSGYECHRLLGYSLSYMYSLQMYKLTLRVFDMFRWKSHRHLVHQCNRKYPRSSNSTYVYEFVYHSPLLLSLNGMHKQMPLNIPPISLHLTVIPHVTLVHLLE